MRLGRRPALLLALLAGVSGFAPARLEAAPHDDAIVAAMRLADEPGYTWVTTISDDARTYTVRGQTSRDGFSRVSMPVINSLRRPLGRDTTDTDIELIFRGNVRCVVETDDGWRTPAEVMSQQRGDKALPARRTASQSGATPRPPHSGGDAAASIYRGTAGLDLGAGLPSAGTDVAPAPRAPLAYSNLQLALSRPHEELGIIVSSHATLSLDGDVVSGTLTELGAQLLLVREGQNALTPRQASGTFRLWLRDGHVARYELKLQGLIDVTSPAGARQVRVNQSSDTVIRSVGVTTIEVPLGARERLGG